MGGLILIGLGIVFLLMNFGWVSWAIFAFLWQFWPILLILCGLQLMVSGWEIGRIFVRIVSFAVVVYVFLFALYATSPAIRPMLEPLDPYFPTTEPWQLDDTPFGRQQY